MRDSHETWHLSVDDSPIPNGLTKSSGSKPINISSDSRLEKEGTNSLTLSHSLLIKTSYEPPGHHSLKIVQLQSPKQIEDFNSSLKDHQNNAWFT